MLSLAALLLLVAPGCGDDTTTAADMAMTPADLSMTAGGDMMKYQTCAQILSCAQACGQNQTCAIGCAGNAVSAAQLKFLALGNCVVGVCGPGDGGSHMCMNAADTSPACANCIGTAGVAASQVGNVCYPQFSDCASH